MSDPKKKRGRPVEHKLPEPIPDTPENIMKAFLKTPPKKREEWKFVQERASNTKDSDILTAPRGYDWI